MKRYKWISVDDAVAGEVLFEDIHDGQGAVLLPAETALTDSMLKSLGRRGIDAVCVVNNDVSEEALAAERERVRLRLAMLFRRCNTESASSELLQHMTNYRMGGLE